PADHMAQGPTLTPSTAALGELRSSFVAEFACLDRGFSRGRALPRDAAGGLAALLQVLLVVVLGPVEGGRRDDLGDDRAAEGPLALQLPLRGQGRRLLLGIVKEDRRAVLRADVRALAIRGRGIVILPEH